MKPKIVVSLIAIALLGLFFVESACGRRRVHNKAEGGAAQPEENIARGDATPDPKVAEARLTESDGEGVDFPEREEIRRSYKLQPSALVNIHGINGKVSVETADTGTAEVLIVRSARKREDLQYHQVSIEHEPERLMIRVDNDRKSVFSSLGSIPEGRQRLVLRLPKKVDFETNGLNGNLRLGEIAGRVEIRGVNGKVKVDQVSGETEVSGINGGIDITFARSFGARAQVRGVNGNIDLQFVGEVNANLNAWSVNGNVDPDLPNVERQESEPKRGRIKARIGNGGAVIEVHNVNGNVHLMKAEKTSTAAAKS